VIPGAPVVAPASGAEVLPAIIPATRRKWPLGVLGAALVVAAGLAWWHPWAAALTTVRVETVALGPATRVLAVNGRVAGVASVDLRPSVAGVLNEVPVIEGQVVARGEVLARIDSATAEAALRQALAGLDAALVAKAEVQASYTRILAMGANVARVTLETSARAVTSAGQEVARQGALLDQARILLAKYTLRAPLAGTVLSLPAKPGQTVASSEVLMTIADLDRLVVETDVDESHALQVKAGQVANLQLTGETRVRPAHVSFVAGQVDASTGGLVVKITPDEPIRAPIGLTVTANITIDTRSALTIPRAALTGDAVFVESAGLPTAAPSWSSPGPPAV